MIRFIARYTTQLCPKVEYAEKVCESFEDAVAHIRENDPHGMGNVFLEEREQTFLLWRRTRSWMVGRTAVSNGTRISPRNRQRGGQPML